MSDKIKIGKHGENLAAEFMVSKGWQIVARNYKFGKAEIDLIVTKEDWLLFIEVKTRSTFHFGEPEEFVDMKKVNLIYFAAEQYIFKNDWRGKVRLDVISVRLGEKVVIEHFEDGLS
jgi:putative endonuclease